jgi:hypothetical protein
MAPRLPTIGESVSMRPTFRTLKIDDEGALEALVVEHVESLETGLRIKGERVLLGRGAVDLVALDGESRLVLIAIALVADDAMMLRMLEAFAWCLEYPDAVGRLYAVDPAALAVPPRVMFVSERLSDAFLRKVKYLKMPSIDCLEFRYLEVDGVSGLYFYPVDTPSPAAAEVSPAVVIAPAPVPVVRGTPMPEPVESVAPINGVEPVAARPAELPSPAPGPVMGETPMPEPVESVAQHVGAVEPVTVEAANPAAPVPGIRATASSQLRALRSTTEARPGELLKGLRIPQNLSSQWQRILNRAVDAPDPAKIRVIREYLQTEFPGCVLSDFYEHKRAAQIFHVQNSQDDLLHVAAISDDFLKTEAERDIRRFLDGNRLSRVLRDAGPTAVLVTPSGLQVSKG